MLFVGDVVEPDPLTLTCEVTVDAALDALAPGSVAAGQRLFPVVEDGRLVAVISENGLREQAMAGLGGARVADAATRRPVCVFADDTLRRAAVVMADEGLTRLPVVRRSDPHEVIGVVSLQQLLAGRLKDLQEERETERVLRLRAPRFSRAASART